MTPVELGDRRRSFLNDSPESSTYPTPPYHYSIPDELMMQRSGISRNAYIPKSLPTTTASNITPVRPGSRHQSKEEDEDIVSPTPNPDRPRSSAQHVPRSKEQHEEGVGAGAGGRKVSNESERFSLKRSGSSTGTSHTESPGMIGKSRLELDPRDILLLNEPVSQTSHAQGIVEELGMKIKMEQDEKVALEREVSELRRMFGVEREKFDVEKERFEVERRKFEVERERWVLEMEKARFDYRKAEHEISQLKEEVKKLSEVGVGKDKSLIDLESAGNDVVSKNMGTQTESRDLEAEHTVSQSTQTEHTINKSTQTETPDDEVEDTSHCEAEMEAGSESEASTLRNPSSPSKFPEFSYDMLNQDCLPYYKDLGLELIDELSNKDKEYLLKKVMWTFMIKFNDLDVSIERFAQFVLIVYQYLNKLHLVVYPGHKLKCSDYYRGRVYRDGRVDEDMVGLQECLEGMMKIIHDSLHGEKLNS
ncbi:hypothetical protein Cantr_08951 [Candida viswanathii]|uniref:Uncharacterized protein n=1 Tax=Candida viswanathii TaxID=5486 RepID=A0A367YCR4_9ASCO|nr:hypothetical protein Cantr_08951 [Candida viswanathii]